MISFEETSNLGRGPHIKVKLTKKVGPTHSQYKRLKGKPVTTDKKGTDLFIDSEK
jgi:hypothetical protein